MFPAVFTTGAPKLVTDIRRSFLFQMPALARMHGIPISFTVLAAAAACRPDLASV
jgi:hypothetical protein